MNLRQLSYFKTVAECGNVSTASTKLYVSQPALTKQIQKLESELNTVLFTRTSTGMFLTPAGTCLLEHLPLLESALNTISDNMKHFASGCQLTELFVFSQDASPIHHLIPGFSAAHPEVTAKTQTDESLDLEKSLLEHRATITFSTEPILHARILSLPLYTEQLGVQLEAAHPLAHVPSLTLKDIEGIELLTYIHNRRAWEFFQRIQKLSGCTLNLHYIGDFYCYQQELKTARYAVLSSNVEVQHMPPEDGFVFVPLTGDQTSLTYYLSFLKANESRLTTFLQWCNDYIQISASN